MLNLAAGLIDQEAGAAGFQSFWESSHALVASEDVIAAERREAARRASRPPARGQ
jgi:hypothetical protein